MDEPDKPLRGIVGAHPCGRPAGVLMRLSSLDQPMEQFVGINATIGAPTFLIANLSLKVCLLQGCSVSFCPCCLEFFFAQAFTGGSHCLYVIRAVDRWHRSHYRCTDSSGSSP